MIASDRKPEEGIEVPKKKKRGMPRRRGRDGNGPVNTERSGPLPHPNVTSPDGGDDPAKFGEAGVRGMTINPVYAGVGDYPQLVTDELWVAAARRVLAQDGPDQFLVNLLYVLRRTFGCVEWNGHLPRDRN